MSAASARPWVTALATFVLASCATNGQAPSERPVGFIAVGDTGYHVDYLGRDDYDPPRSHEQFLAAERAEWIEDGRPLADFVAPPTQVHKSNGSVVAASGLYPVADSIRTWCVEHRCDFATLLGDNIYPDGATAGADGRDDATRFRVLFSEPYGPLGKLHPDFRMYAALGNHDWKTSLAGAQSQLRFLERTAPFYMDGFYYRVRPPAAAGQVELFVIDTELLLARKPVPEAAVGADGSGVRLDEYDEVPEWVAAESARAADMVSWLDAALRASDARWKIVLGHHPLWSSAGTKFAQAEVLRALLLPTLCRNADLYLAGHEHTLELHLDDCTKGLPGVDVPPLPIVVSGAGAKQRPVHGPFTAWQRRNSEELSTLRAQGMVWGFAHVLLRGDAAEVRLVTTPNDASGRPVEDFVHRLQRRSGKQGESQ
jgi:tartrate-resistant acid phosphatase type 5